MLLPAIIMLSSVGAFSSLNPYGIGVLFLTVGLCLSVSSRELMSSSERLVHSLPVTRKEYILAKYVSVIPWFILSSLGMAVLVLIPGLFTVGSHYITIDSLYYSFLVSVIGISLLYPIIFTYRKAGMFFFILFIMLILNVGNEVLKIISIHFLSIKIMLIAFLGMLVIASCSYSVTARIFERKDF